MKKILKTLNDREFNLKSLVLEKFVFGNSYNETELYLWEFFKKHGSDLRSLKLKYCLNMEHGPDHNPLEIASRTVFIFFRDWTLDRMNYMLFPMNCCFLWTWAFSIHFPGSNPFKYEIIKRYSKYITHLTIVDCRGHDLVQPINYKMFQNLVHLNIGLQDDISLEKEVFLPISDLNKNLRYLRLSGPVQIETTGKDPCIESCLVICDSSLCRMTYFPLYLRIPKVSWIHDQIFLYGMIQVFLISGYWTLMDFAGPMTI